MRLVFPALIGQAGTQLVFLAGLADLAGSWYLVGRTIANTKPSRYSSLQATAVVWGDKVFTAPAAGCLAELSWRRLRRLGRRHSDAPHVLARH